MVLKQSLRLSGKASDFHKRHWSIYGNPKSSKLVIKFYNKTALKLENFKNNNSTLLGPLGHILTILNIFFYHHENVHLSFHFFKKLIFSQNTLFGDLINHNRLPLKP